MLPLEVSDPGLFGDNLQFVPGRVAFLSELAGVAVSNASPRQKTWRSRIGWMTPRSHRPRPELQLEQGRVPSNEPESAKKIIRDETRSKSGL
jgi:hypothetical protein